MSGGCSPVTVGTRHSLFQPNQIQGCRGAEEFAKTSWMEGHNHIMQCGVEHIKSSLLPPSSFHISWIPIHFLPKYQSYNSELYTLHSVEQPILPIT